MKIVFSTGGTGGHIYPAIALAKYIQNADDSVDILFTGSSKHMEKRIVTESGFKFFGYSISSGSKSIFHKLFQYVQLAFALIKVYFNFVFNRPDAVIGFGAYITAPTLLAAKFLNVPIILHEQNSSIGKTNSMFYKNSKATIVCYADLLKELNLDNVHLLGNPRASEVKDIEENRDILLEFGLDPKKKTVLIVMGSLGSESVNDAMFDLMPKLDQEEIQVIYVTGSKHFEVSEDGKAYDNIVIVPFVDQANVLKNVDLVIARGGATTAAEIAALGVASIIIPSPYVSNNHQYINALELEKLDAAVIIKEEDLSADILINHLTTILKDDKRIKEMGENAKQLAYPNASEDIYNLIKDIIND